MMYLQDAQMVARRLPVRETISTVSEEGMPTSWGKRVGAAIVDWIIIAVIMLIIFVALGYIPPWKTPTIFIIYLLATGVFALWYFPTLEGITTTTIGKRLVNSRVIAVTGYDASGTQTFIRNISKIFILLILIDWIYAIAFGGKYQQRGCDKLAGTTVIVGRLPTRAPLPTTPALALPPRGLAAYEFRARPIPSGRPPELAEEVRSGKCPKCSMPFNIVITESKVTLARTWCNRCIWCDRKLM
jgi:uncharacterized RDD family membrane protein YckC